MNDKSNFNRLVENFDIVFKVRNLSVIGSVFLAFDESAFEKLAMDQILDTTNFVPCILSTIHTFETTELQLKKLNYKEPKFFGFSSEEIRDSASSFMELFHEMYGSSIENAATSFFAIDGQEILTKMLHDYAFDEANTNCQVFVTNAPTTISTNSPTHLPSMKPSSIASMVPSSEPSSLPSSDPSMIPSTAPTSYPTNTSSSVSSAAPTVTPTSTPTATPTSTPTATPTSTPTTTPTSSPTTISTREPSHDSSALPSSVPTSVATGISSVDEDLSTMHTLEMTRLELKSLVYE